MEMILGVQIFGALFGLFIMYLSFVFMKRDEFTNNEWGFWTVLGLMITFLSVFPRILDPFVQTLNMSRKMDLLIIFGFIFLIGAAFYNYVVARRTQRNLEKLVRKLALKNTK